MKIYFFYYSYINTENISKEGIKVSSKHLSEVEKLREIYLQNKVIKIVSEIFNEDI